MDNNTTNNMDNEGTILGINSIETRGIIHKAATTRA